MKALTYLFFPLLLLLLTACEKPIDPPSGLRVGETFEVEDTVFTFASVDGDTRCPCEPLCVWEGVATARLTCGPDLMFLHTTDAGNYSTTVTYGEHTLRLVDLRPPPCDAEPEEAGDYRLTVVVVE